MTLIQIGRGETRRTYIEGDNVDIVVKKANYKNFHNRILGGVCSNKAFLKLLASTRHDPEVSKALDLIAEGRNLRPYAKNTLAEYMVSLIITDEEKHNFAICRKVRVRRSPNGEDISVVGFYENALMKEDLNKSLSIYDLLRGIKDRTGLSIEDIHPGNVIGDYIVDFAAIH